MMRPTLSVIALSVLAGACLAACSANVKPNMAVSPDTQAEAAATQAASASTTSAAAATSIPAPPAATAAPIASTPAAAGTANASPAATATSAPAATPITMPTRGMLMSAVAREFGEPEQKLPAVPDPGTKVHPPITRWVYPQYVVYFEYNYVVHSVLKAHPFSHSNTGTN